VRAGDGILGLHACDTVSREDLAQAYEVERAEAVAEGRRPRPRRWVEADYWRREYGRTGAKRAIAVGGGERIAAAPTALITRRTSLVDRALRMALSLPIEQREPIVMALRCLAPVRAEDRVRAWIELHPERRATHAEIAADCALRRETVTRCISRLRRAR
jgi:CRP-like cAMP-binding protein